MNPNITSTIDLIFANINKTLAYSEDDAPEFHIQNFLDNAIGRITKKLSLELREDANSMNMQARRRELAANLLDDIEYYILCVTKPPSRLLITQDQSLDEFLHKLIELYNSKNDGPFSKNVLNDSINDILNGSALTLPQTALIDILKITRPNEIILDQTAKIDFGFGDVDPIPISSSMQFHDGLIHLIDNGTSLNIYDTIMRCYWCRRKEFNALYIVFGSSGDFIRLYDFEFKSKKAKKHLTFKITMTLHKPHTEATTTTIEGIQESKGGEFNNNTEYMTDTLMEYMSFW